MVGALAQAQSVQDVCDLQCRRGPWLREPERVLRFWIAQHCTRPKALHGGRGRTQQEGARPGPCPTHDGRRASCPLSQTPLQRQDSEGRSHCLCFRDPPQEQQRGSRGQAMGVL